MIVFESDEVQAIFEPGDSDFLLITFGTIVTRPNGKGFFGQPVAQSAGIAALGFVASRQNWYSAADMRKARAALGDLLRPYKQRLTFGYSMGAYGAIKHSGLFNAQTCVAVAPQFSIDPNDVASFDRGYIHFFSEKLHTGMAVTKAEAPGDVFIFYDNRCYPDTRHAAMYKEAIDPFLINVPYTGHGIMRCFTGTKIATTLFSLCRDRDLTTLNAVAQARRRPHHIRAYRVCWMLAFKHSEWAEQVLLNRMDEMSPSEVYELSVIIGHYAAQRNKLELTERVFLRALSIDMPGDNRALVGLANFYFQRGDVQNALELARQAIAIKPKDVDARAWLVSLLIRINDFEEACTEAKTGLAIAPDHVALLANMVDIAENKGDLDDALTWMRKANAAAPDQLRLQERLIRLLMRREEWGLARSEATTLFEKHPSHTGFLWCLADLSDRSGRIDEALDWMRRVKSADPRKAFVLERIARLHIRANDLVAAEQALMAALDINPRQFSLLRGMSDICIRKNRFDEAITWLLKASAVEPDNTVIAETIGNCAIRVGDFQTARDVVTGALERDPGNVRLMLCLADAYERQADYTQASEWLQKARAADGGNVLVRERLVNVSVRGGDFALVREVAMEIIDLDPHNTNVMSRLVDAHERLSEFTEAVVWARKAFDANPAAMYLRERLAHLLIVTDNLPAAEQILLAALDIDATHFGSLRYLADVMLRRRRYDQAVAYAERAANFGPTNAWFRDWYASLLLFTGDADAADVQIREGLRLEPDNVQLLRRAAMVEAQLALPRPWVAAIPDGNVGKYWQHRNADLANSTRIAQPRVLFMGDSITDRWAMAGKVAWDQHLAPLGVGLSAIPNETTQGLLWRVENGAIDGISPDDIVLLIGTNNVGRHRTTDIVAGIEQLWTEITSRLPNTRLLALAILPRDPSPESWHRIQVNQINDELKLRAERRRIEFLDLADCLLEPDGTLSPDMAPDGIHLSAAGYQQITPRISEKLAELRRNLHPNPYSTSAV